MVDTLSRTFDAPVSLSAIAMPIPTWLHSDQQEYVNESSLSEIIQPLASNPSVVPYFSWDGSSLRYKGHLVLPQSIDLQHDVFYQIHASPSVGNSEFLKTYERNCWLPTTFLFLFCFWSIKFDIKFSLE